MFIKPAAVPRSVRGNDVVDRGEDAGIVDPFANSERRKCEDQDVRGIRETGDDDPGDAAQERDRLRKHATAGDSPRPKVGKPTADQDADCVRDRQNHIADHRRAENVLIEFF